MRVLGLPLYLRCYGGTSQGFLAANRYSWYKDGKQLNLPHSSFRRPLILRAHYRDAGVYTCVLRSSVGSSTKTINVTIIGKNRKYFVALYSWDRNTASRVDVRVILIISRCPSWLRTVEFPLYSYALGGLRNTFFRYFNCSLWWHVHMPFNWERT